MLLSYFHFLSFFLLLSSPFSFLSFFFFFLFSFFAARLKVPPGANRLLCPLGTPLPGPRAVCKSLTSSLKSSPKSLCPSLKSSPKSQSPSLKSSLKSQSPSLKSSPKSKWTSQIKSHEQIKFLERIITQHWKALEKNQCIEQDIEKLYFIEISKLKL